MKQKNNAIRVFRKDIRGVINTLYAISDYKLMTSYVRTNKNSNLKLPKSEFFNLIDEFEKEDLTGNLLLINSYAILESYLRRRVEDELGNNPSIIEKLVKKYKIQRKLLPEDVINGPKLLAQEIIESIIYHNFSKVNVIYQIVFDLDILNFIPKKILKYVKIRHELVHRTGIINEKRIFVSSVSLEILLQDISDWVENIEFFIKNKRLPKKVSKINGALKKRHKVLKNCDVYPYIIDQAVTRIFSIDEEDKINL